jgi:hypothetical protein
MTLEDVREECTTIQTIAQYLGGYPNWLSIGNLALRKLVRTLAWDYAGSLAGDKSFPLVATGAYTFTAGEAFTGNIKALTVYWSGTLPLTDGKACHITTLRGEALLQEGTFGTADQPEAVVDGQTIRCYPLPTAGTSGILQCHYVMRPVTFTELTDSIQVSDDAALALELTMGAFAVKDTGRVPPMTAMGRLLQMADGEVAELNRKVKRGMLILPMPALRG